MECTVRSTVKGNTRTITFHIASPITATGWGKIVCARHYSVKGSQNCQPPVVLCGCKPLCFCKRAKSCHALNAGVPFNSGPFCTYLMCACRQPWTSANYCFTRCYPVCESRWRGIAETLVFSVPSLVNKRQLRSKRAHCRRSFLLLTVNVITQKSLRWLFMYATVRTCKVFICIFCFHRNHRCLLKVRCLESHSRDELPVCVLATQRSLQESRTGQRTVPCTLFSMNEKQNVLYDDSHFFRVLAVCREF